MKKQNRKYPTLKVEKNLWDRGYEHIVGIDEAGCGCWAGPLVAAAAILSPKFKDPGVMDSKMLTELKREKYHDIIIDRLVDYGIGEASASEIDKHGLTQAKILATKRALKNLKVKPDYLLLDGYNINLTGYSYEAVIKGDQKIKSIACASILAKVYRDRMIRKIASKYPEYKFEKNKCYGTKDHIEALEKYGICDIHRRSYKPIKKILNKKIT